MIKNDTLRIKELLDSHFPSLAENVREKISETSSLAFIEKGKMMTRTGNHLKNVVLVAEGYMKVYRENSEGGELFLYYLAAGNACALSMVCASKQETSEVMIRALEDSQVVLLPITVMETLMKNHKSWYQFVVETYRSRFDDLLEAFDSVAFKRLDERLLQYLYNQSEAMNTKALIITHQQIADDLHSKREVISRLLKTMEEKGFLAINRNSLLLKKDAIARYLAQ